MKTLTIEKVNDEEYWIYFNDRKNNGMLVKADKVEILRSGGKVGIWCSKGGEMIAYFRVEDYEAKGGEE